MDIKDYVYTNHEGKTIVDNNGFCEDFTSMLLCCNIFGKEHIELIEKILLDNAMENSVLYNATKRYKEKEQNKCKSIYNNDTYVVHDIYEPSEIDKYKNRIELERMISKEHPEKESNKIEIRHYFMEKIREQHPEYDENTLNCKAIDEMGYFLNRVRIPNINYDEDVPKNNIAYEIKTIDKLQEKENFINKIKKSLNEIDKDIEFEYLITQHDSIIGFAFISSKPYTLCVAKLDKDMDIKKAIYDAIGNNDIYEEDGVVKRYKNKEELTEMIKKEHPEYDDDTINNKVEEMEKIKKIHKLLRKIAPVIQEIQDCKINFKWEK